jgi:hypothetical protein
VGSQQLGTEEKRGLGAFPDFIKQRLELFFKSVPVATLQVPRPRRDRSEAGPGAAHVLARNHGA